MAQDVPLADNIVKLVYIYEISLIHSKFISNFFNENQVVYDGILEVGMPLCSNENLL